MYDVEYLIDLGVDLFGSVFFDECDMMSGIDFGVVFFCMSEYF